MRLTGVVWWLTAVPFIRGFDERPLASWALRRQLVKEYGAAERRCRKIAQLEKMAAGSLEHYRGQIEREAATARKRRQEALNALLKAGLERRCPMPETAEDQLHPFGPRLDSRARDFYQRLLAAGAELPERVRVCQVCLTVFATKAKGRAKSCPRCHRARKPEPSLRSWHLSAWVAEFFDDEGDPSDGRLGIGPVPSLQRQIPIP